MKLQPLTALALLASGVVGQALEQCSTNSTLPCSCPAGTEYAESATFVILGAGAPDVKNLIADCEPAAQVLLLRYEDTSKHKLTCSTTVYNTSWTGLLPIATVGPDNTPGSQRTFRVPTKVGTYNITEVVSFVLSSGIQSFPTVSLCHPRIPETLSLTPTRRTVNPILSPWRWLLSNQIRTAFSCTIHFRLWLFRRILGHIPGRVHLARPGGPQVVSLRMRDWTSNR